MPNRRKAIKVGTKHVMSYLHFGVGIVVSGICRVNYLEAQPLYSMVSWNGIPKENAQMLEMALLKGFAHVGVEGAGDEEK